MALSAEGFIGSRFSQLGVKLAHRSPRSGLSRFRALAVRALPAAEILKAQT